MDWIDQIRSAEWEHRRCANELSGIFTLIKGDNNAAGKRHAALKPEKVSERQLVRPLKDNKPNQKRKSRQGKKQKLKRVIKRKIFFAG